MSTQASIAADTRMGVVSLVVADLDRSLHFYAERLGLQTRRVSDVQARVGAGGRDLLLLTEQAGAKPVQRGCAGLYHYALLLPSRVELARAFRRLLETATPLQGLSDHGVSEAIYLADPDGHGIELYRDRERSTWPKRGELPAMGIEELDYRGLLREVEADAGDRPGIHAETTMGHVHLHVAHLDAAETFYCTLLGFELQQRMGRQAAFVSAGGYHHHLGLNVWAGVGAPPPPADAARLLWFEIVLPDSLALEAVLQRVRAAGLAVEFEGPGRARLADPSQNSIVLVNAAAPASGL